MITNFVYRQDKLLQNISRQDLAKTLWEKDSFIWVDLEDPTEFETEILIELFNFHPLSIEDCINDHSEPKIDEYDEYLFMVVHAIDVGSSAELKTKELNVFINKNYVVTFHKNPIASVAEVRNLVEKKAGGPMSEGLDMLVHAILDRLVDKYLPVITEQDRRLDEIEDTIFKGAGEQVLQQILDIQKGVLYLKRIIGPQRDKMAQLSRSAWTFVRPQNLAYYRDIYDHLFKYYQMAEELNGLLNGILQVYFSHVSYQLNKAIKTMTVIATVSIPSVAIASVYGMNFKYIPHLEWKYGFHFSIGLMIAISAILMIWMKIKKWY